MHSGSIKACVLSKDPKGLMTAPVSHLGNINLAYLKEGQPQVIQTALRCWQRALTGAPSGLDMNLDACPTNSETR